MKNLFFNKKGQVLSMMPFIVIMALAFSVFFVDIGMTYKSKVQMQNIVDSMARAGAYYGTAKGGYTVRPVPNSTEKYVIVNLNESVAERVATLVYEKNIELASTNNVNLKVYDLNTSKVYNLAGQTVNSNEKVKKKLNGVTAPYFQNGDWVDANVADFPNNDAMYWSGNFSVMVEAKYNTIMAQTIFGNGNTVDFYTYAQTFSSAKVK